ARAERLDAWEGGAGAPAIPSVRRELDMRTDLQGEPRTPEDYAAPDWDLEAYLEEYDPAHYEGDPEGALEDARARSQQAQLDSVQLVVPSNVTLLGEAAARLIGASLILPGDNISVRGRHLTGMEDCFPQCHPHARAAAGFAGG